MNISSLLKDPRQLPPFVLDLIAAMPARGEGLHKWLFCVAQVLHPYRAADEIIQLLQAATAGEPVEKGEIESAVERSKSVAWKAGQKRTATIQPAWPKIDTQKRQEIIAAGENLTDLWEASPVRMRLLGLSRSDLPQGNIAPPKTYRPHSNA